MGSKTLLAIEGPMRISGSEVAAGAMKAGFRCFLGAGSCR